jgi:DNA-directed RNA polymerase subunit RPC12/RpoP
LEVLHVPIYEYERRECQAVSGFLVMKKEDEKKIACLRCGGRKMFKVVSRTTYHRSEADRLSEFETQKPTGEDFYKDSRNIGLWAKKRAKELGADLGPQFDEIVENARTGKILKKYGL